MIGGRWTLATKCVSLFKEKTGGLGMVGEKGVVSIKVYGIDPRR